MTRYGITDVQYDEMFSTQDGRCAICKHTSSKKLHVDHNANTGEVRGLLCGECNMGIGLFYEQIEIMESAIEYLRTRGAL